MASLPQQSSPQGPFPVSENVARMRPSATLAAMQAAVAMRAGETKYTRTAGTRRIQQAVIGYYERAFGASYEPSEVMATAGGKQAIFNAVVTLAGKGDEVLIPKPYWVTFPEIVNFSGA